MTQAVVAGTGEEAVFEEAGERAVMMGEECEEEGGGEGKGVWDREFEARRGDTREDLAIMG